MTESWEVLATCVDQFSAEAQAGILRDDGIPVKVRVDSSLPGLVGEAQILVPRLKLDRARWIIGRSKISEDELCVAATGAQATPDELRTDDLYVSRSDQIQSAITRKRSPFYYRITFFALLAGASFCNWAAGQQWTGPWRGTSGLLFAMASWVAIWALIEGLVPDRPRKSD